MCGICVVGRVTVVARVCGEVRIRLWESEGEGKDEGESKGVRM
jgi:hypothetical protein